MAGLRPWSGSALYSPSGLIGSRSTAGTRSHPYQKWRVLSLAGGAFCRLGIAGDAEVGRETASNYVTLLAALHLVTLLPAWSTNITNRAKRRPKVVVTDTGLAADLCGLGEQTFAPTADGTAAGSLFETFVITEVLKQATWSERSAFRKQKGRPDTKSRRPPARSQPSFLPAEPSACDASTTRAAIPASAAFR